MNHFKLVKFRKPVYVFTISKKKCQTKYDPLKVIPVIIMVFTGSDQIDLIVKI